MVHKCQHTSVRFASGDYYIQCDHCGNKWCKHDSVKQEYSEKVGASPESAHYIDKPVRVLKDS